MATPATATPATATPATVPVPPAPVPVPPAPPPAPVPVPPSPPPAPVPVPPPSPPPAPPPTPPPAPPPAPPTTPVTTEKPVEKPVPVKFDPKLPVLLRFGDETKSISEYIHLDVNPKIKINKKANFTNSGGKGIGGSRELIDYYGVSKDDTTTIQTLQKIFGVNYYGGTPKFNTYIKGTCRFLGLETAVKVLTKRKETLEEHLKGVTKSKQNGVNDRNQQHLLWLNKTLETLAKMKDFEECPPEEGEKKESFFGDFDMFRDIVFIMGLLQAKAVPELQKRFESLTLQQIIDIVKANDSMKKKTLITKGLEALGDFDTLFPDKTAGTLEGPQALRLKLNNIMALFSLDPELQKSTHTALVPGSGMNQYLQDPKAEICQLLTSIIATLNTYKTGFLTAIACLPGNETNKTFCSLFGNDADDYKDELENGLIEVLNIDKVLNKELTGKGYKLTSKLPKMFGITYEPSGTLLPYFEAHFKQLNGLGIKKDGDDYYIRREGTFFKDGFLPLGLFVIKYILHLTDSLEKKCATATPAAPPAPPPAPPPAAPPAP